MGLTSNIFVQKRNNTTSLKQPKELGFYSKTQDSTILVGDASKLSYFYFPDALLDKELDLTAGIKKFKECSKSHAVDPCSLHGLLSTIQAYEIRKNKRVGADIITFRGVIRKLISSAFDSPKFNPVDLRIIVFDGQIFIKEFNQPHTSSGTPQSVEFRSYYSGYKFESLVTIPKPLPNVSRTSLEKRPKKIVNNGDQFISVVRTGVGRSKLVLGAEIDCIFDFKEDSIDNLKHYAELKCTKGVTTFAEAQRFERKIFRTWLQCFLVGVNRIIYGFRDDNFILRSVEEYTTNEIPLILKENNPQLSNVCLDAIKWYGAFTEWLLATLPRDNDPGLITAYRLVFENNHLKLTEIENGHPEYEGLVKGEDVLSDEFKKWRMSASI